MFDAVDTFVTVWHDGWLLAADKPAGLLVHGDGTGAASLTGLVRTRTGAACAQPVQRLDVETTGLVLFSLDKAVQPALDTAVATGGIRKRYIALVAGRIARGERTVEAAIGRDRHDARRMRISKTGKPSVTILRPLGVFDNATLVELELKTGRRHQIRVHMAAVGHPVVGDALYRGPASARGLMLHALEERLVHPVTGEELLLRTAWPERFANLDAPQGHDWYILKSSMTRPDERG